MGGNLNRIVLLGVALASMGSVQAEALKNTIRCDNQNWIPRREGQNAKNKKYRSCATMRRAATRRKNIAKHPRCQQG